jgi:hypothetical protein
MREVRGHLGRRRSRSTDTSSRRDTLMTWRTSSGRSAPGCRCAEATEDAGKGAARARSTRSNEEPVQDRAVHVRQRRRARGGKPVLALGAGAARGSLCRSPGGALPPCRWPLPEARRNTRPTSPRAARCRERTRGRRRSPRGRGPVRSASALPTVGRWRRPRRSAISDPIPDGRAG